MSEIIIKPQTKWWQIDLRELWQYRELAGVLAWRDVTVRYKQTLLGVSWAIFQPIVTTGIFSIFFGKIANIPSDGMPYPLFSLIGLTLWNFFSNAVSNVSNSLINNGGIISKVYLPKLIIPFSSVVTSAVDFGITSILVVAALIFFGIFPGLAFLWSFPILLFILVLTILGIGLFMAGINILYRDVRYILPFFIQVGLYVSPIIYPLSVIYDWRKYVLYFNPLSSVIEGSRLLVSGKSIDPTLTLVGFVVSVLLFIIGVYTFRKIENRYVDIS